MKIKHIIITVCLTSLGVLGLESWLSPVLEHAPMHSAFVTNKNFSPLVGWDNADLRPSLLAFRKSCQVFLKLNPEKNVGTAEIVLKAKDWQPVCRAASQVNAHSNSRIRDFFQSWFKPRALSGKKPAEGLFTGYYAPSINGSRSQSGRYNLPIYAAKTSKVLFWVATNKDRVILTTEGSAVILMEDGSRVPVEYVKGSGQHVYFQETADHEFHGAQDVALSPGYSMAIDKRSIPLGIPLWLNTTVAQNLAQKAQPLRRLMIAQDIGSAIRGAVRGDLYWGEGKNASSIGSNIKSKGTYWLLLPKKVG